jgi:hypothetical protein
MNVSLSALFIWCGDRSKSLARSGATKRRTSLMSGSTSRRQRLAAVNRDENATDGFLIVTCNSLNLALKNRTLKAMILKAQALTLMALILCLRKMCDYRRRRRHRRICWVMLFRRLAWQVRLERVLPLIAQIRHRIGLARDKPIHNLWTTIAKCPLLRDVARVRSVLRHGLARQRLGHLVS